MGFYFFPHIGFHDAVGFFELLTWRVRIYGVDHFWIEKTPEPANTQCNTTQETRQLSLSPTTTANQQIANAVEQTRARQIYKQEPTWRRRRVTTRVGQKKNQSHEILEGVAPRGPLHSKRAQPTKKQNNRRAPLVGKARWWTASKTILAIFCKMFVHVLALHVGGWGFWHHERLCLPVLGTGKQMVPEEPTGHLDGTVLDFRSETDAAFLGSSDFWQNDPAMARAQNLCTKQWATVSLLLLLLRLLLLLVVSNVFY